MYIGGTAQQIRKHETYMKVHVYSTPEKEKGKKEKGKGEKKKP